MKNWMQKYEDDKEKTEEDILKERLNRLLDLVDNVKNYKVEDRIKCLSYIVELYEKLEKNEYELDKEDKKDMILRKKQLTELKWKQSKNEYMKTKESESWSDYREEEIEEEER